MDVSASEVVRSPNPNTPWMWVHLLEFELVRGNGNSKTIEDEETRACGSLIDGPDVPILELLFILSRHLLV